MKWLKRINKSCRIVTKFLLLPKYLPQNASTDVEEYRWLCFACVYQEFDGRKYVDICWVNLT